MPKFETVQMAAAFENSQSGKGVRLDGVEQLRAFADFAHAHNAVVCNVETFQVRGEHEVARVDLSIYQGGTTEQALPGAERIKLSGECLREALAAMEAEGAAYVFQVWADQLDADT